MPIAASNPPTVPAPLFDRYSHTVTVGLSSRLLFVSGQVAIDEDGEIVGRGDLAAQSERIFELLGRILTYHGAGFDDVVSIRTFVTDITQLAPYGEVRRRYLPVPRPTSTTVEVSRLFNADALIEVEIVAELDAPAAP
jgi:enamine deaminase RidA (YjgF/YER057c/UK114 family)